MASKKGGQVRVKNFKKSQEKVCPFIDLSLTSFIKSYLTLKGRGFEGVLYLATIIFKYLIFLIFSCF